MFGIVGGSGLYDLEGLEIKNEHNVETIFGRPSAPIIEGEYEGQVIMFLPRHGRGHELLPHEINYRANIFALKQLGVRSVLSVSAVGSLLEEIRPGDLALPDQYFDHTRGLRRYSFFGDGLGAHISTANPVCPALASDIKSAADRINQQLHTGKTYGCVEGPRLGTRAESFFLRDAARCDLVGMTNIPEAFLAREAQMAYGSLCLVTDYDCWMDDPEQHVSVDKFLEIYAATLGRAKTLISEFLKGSVSDAPDNIRNALTGAVITNVDHMTDEQKNIMSVLDA
jgi:5'-methylthioadenosine phosphorylase